MVYVTSDLHGAFDIHKINPDEFKQGRTLTSKDYLAVCGDFGCIWDGGSSDRFWLNWLESLPWTTVFIDGNHENFDVLETYPTVDWMGGKARRIRSNIYQLLRGEIYEFDGKTWLCLGGGYSHDQKLRKEHVNWWNEEIFSADEASYAMKNLEDHQHKVDVILSHDVYTAHPLSGKFRIDQSVYTSDRIDQHEFLEDVRRKTDYSLWICGHYHKDMLTFEENRPCWMLFDQVREIDSLMLEASQVQSEDDMIAADDEAEAVSRQDCTLI